MRHRMINEPGPKTGKRRSRAWLIAIGVVVLAVVILGLAVIWPEKDSYTVDGIPFRTWLAQRPDFSIQDPISALGTNAVPHLLGIIRLRGDSTLAEKVREQVWKMLTPSQKNRFPNWQPRPVWQLKRTAYFGLRFLGPAAKTALPEVIRFGRAETNMMVRATALNAALSIAPESPDTFAFWREDWERTNYYSRRDLAIYLRAARYPITAAIPLLLQQITNNLSQPPVDELQAFEYMGEAARPAVPYMVQVMGTGGNTFSGNMIVLLGRLGPVASNAAPALGAVLKQPDPGIVGAALETLAALGPPARAALPDLEPWITNSDSELRMMAAFARAQIEQDSESAIPVLVGVLENKVPRLGSSYLHVQFRQEMDNFVTGGAQAALILLGRLGPGARSALPAVEARLRDTNPLVRLDAAKAEWQITHDPTKGLPVLIDLLNSQAVEPTAGRSPAAPISPSDFVTVNVAELLEDMGPAALPAVGALERVRNISGRIRRAVDAALLGIGSVQEPSKDTAK